MSHVAHHTPTPHIGPAMSESHIHGYVQHVTRYTPPPLLNEFALVPPHLNAPITSIGSNLRIISSTGSITISIIVTISRPQARHMIMTVLQAAQRHDAHAALK